MAEAAVRIDPPSLAQVLDGPGVSVRAASFAGRWSLRAGEAVAAVLSRASGFPLPDRMLHSASVGGRHGLRLGPDEWLLLADAVEPAGLEDQIVSDGPFSLVDVSHRNIGLVLTGPSAVTALNAGIPLDLSDAAFPAGGCTRTLLGKAEVVLWRASDAPVWRLEFWRSYSDYVTRFLAQAVADLG